jgi:hypothetical protein
MFPSSCNTFLILRFHLNQDCPSCNFKFHNLALCDLALRAIKTEVGKNRWQDFSLNIICSWLRHSQLMATTKRWLSSTALFMHLHPAGLSCSLCTSDRRLQICFTILESNLHLEDLPLRKFHRKVVTLFVEWNACTKDIFSGLVTVLDEYYNENNAVAMEASLQ